MACMHMYTLSMYQVSTFVVRGHTTLYVQTEKFAYLDFWQLIASYQTLPLYGGATLWDYVQALSKQQMELLDVGS